MKKFKYSFSVPCTKEEYNSISKDLIELGYNDRRNIYVEDNKYLVTNWCGDNDMFGLDTEPMSVYQRINIDSFNRDLIIALAAATEGDEFYKGEWTIAIKSSGGGSYIAGDFYKLVKDQRGYNLYTISKYNKFDSFDVKNFRKPTAEEIIEYFTPKVEELPENYVIELDDNYSFTDQFNSINRKLPCTLGKGKNYKYLLIRNSKIYGYLDTYHPQYGNKIEFDKWQELINKQSMKTLPREYLIQGKEGDYKVILHFVRGAVLSDEWKCFHICNGALINSGLSLEGLSSLTTEGKPAKTLPIYNMNEWLKLISKEVECYVADGNTPLNKSKPMKKKVIGYKLKKDLPGIPKGNITARGATHLEWYFGDYGSSMQTYNESQLNSNPEWFEPIYEETSKTLVLGFNQLKILISQDGKVSLWDQYETNINDLKRLLGEVQKDISIGTDKNSLFATISNKQTRIIRIGRKSENNCFSIYEIEQVINVYNTLNK